VISIYSIKSLYIVEMAKEDASFGRRAFTALGISIIADGLDYFAAPLFSAPLIGDVFDSVVTSLLYSITKSKLSTAINLIEFIPIVGDFIPVYTLSTLLWISKELKNSNKIKYEDQANRDSRITNDVGGTIRRRLMQQTK
jgi:hypothetical protein